MLVAQLVVAVMVGVELEELSHYLEGLEPRAAEVAIRVGAQVVTVVVVVAAWRAGLVGVAFALALAATTLLEPGRRFREARATGRA